jgi:hypothetical protein
MLISARVYRFVAFIASASAALCVQARPVLENPDTAEIAAASSREHASGFSSPVGEGPSVIQRLDGTTIAITEAERKVTQLMTAAEVIGAGIAIINDGKVVYLKAYGLRDTQKNLPLTVDLIMSVASLSKAAFAYMTMQLVEKGVLDLDRPVYLYLPKPLADYPNYADLASDERCKRITARMLLSHTAGFANFRGAEQDGKLRIHFEPGSKICVFGRRNQFAAICGGDHHKEAVGTVNAGTYLSALGDDSDQHGLARPIRGRLRKQLRRRWEASSTAEMAPSFCGGFDVNYDCRLFPVH